MDHQEIEDRQVVSLYLTKKLSAEEQARFEEHLLDCAQCLDELELAEGFRDGLRKVAGDGAPGVPQAFHGPFAWLAQMRVPQQSALLVAAVVLLVGAPVLFLLIHSARLNRELEAERKDSSSWREQYSAEKQAREGLENQLARAAAPQFAAPLFSVPLTRGGDLDNPDAGTRVVVPRSGAPWIVLSLEMPPAPEFQSYRAQLSDASGKSIWSTADIPSPAAGALAISLRSSLLHDGKYVLTLDGVTRNGRSARAGTYLLRVMQK